MVKTLNEFFNLKQFQFELAKRGYKFSRTTLYEWQKQGLFSPMGRVSAGGWNKVVYLYTMKEVESLIKKISSRPHN